MTPTTLLAAFQLYLRGDLAKLRNQGDADDFVRKSRADLAALRLPTTAAGLETAFGDQASVDAYVKALDLETAHNVIRACGAWRENGVAQRLLHARAAVAGAVLADGLRLRQAEPTYGYIFERHDYWLRPIANDPEIAALPPYSSHGRGDHIEIETCLATPDSQYPGVPRLLDGMHRSIQLVWNGRNAIDVCVVYP